MSLCLYVQLVSPLLALSLALLLYPPHTPPHKKPLPIMFSDARRNLFLSSSFCIYYYRERDIEGWRGETGWGIECARYAGATKV